MLPVALDAEPLELLALHVEPVLGIGAAFLAERDHRRRVGQVRLLLVLGAVVLLLDLPFDRQAVAVPARHVVGIVAEHLLAARHHVLEDLVERVCRCGCCRWRKAGRRAARTCRGPWPPRAAACRGRASAQRLRISGSFCGRPARIGKFRLRQEQRLGVVALGLRCLGLGCGLVVHGAVFSRAVSRQRFHRRIAQRRKARRPARAPARRARLGGSPASILALSASRRCRTSAPAGSSR